VKQKKKSRAAATGKRHAQTMREFMAFLGPRAKLNIAAITSRDIASFRDHRHSLGLAPATVNIDVAILSAAFNAALRQGHISVNPCLAIEPLKNKPQRKGVFSPEQVAALLKTAKGDWRGLIMLAFYTGQRLLDCANLRWRDVDLVSDIKLIRFQTRKTGAEIVTVIHPSLEDHLLSLPTPKSDDEYIFSDVGRAQSESAQQAIRRVDGAGAHRTRRHPRAHHVRRSKRERPLLSLSAAFILVDLGECWHQRRIAHDHRRPLHAGDAREVHAPRA
jgi:integrase